MDDGKLFNLLYFKVERQIVGSSLPLVISTPGFFGSLCFLLSQLCMRTIHQPRCIQRMRCSLLFASRLLSETLTMVPSSTMRLLALQRSSHLCFAFSSLHPQSYIFRFSTASFHCSAGRFRSKFFYRKFVSSVSISHRFVRALAAPLLPGVAHLPSPSFHDHGCARSRS